MKKLILAACLAVISGRLAVAQKEPGNVKPLVQKPDVSHRMPDGEVVHKPLSNEAVRQINWSEPILPDSRS